MDYLDDLKRHTKGRRALHLRLSILEKHYLESFYKIKAGAAIKKLVDRQTGRSFALSNADLIVITLDVSLDDFGLMMSDIYKLFAKSAVIRSLDPAVGKDDVLSRWFNLEKDYADFKKYIADIVAPQENERKYSAKVISSSVKSSSPDFALGAKDQTTPATLAPSVGGEVKSVLTRSAGLRKIVHTEFDQVNRARSVRAHTITPLEKEEKVKDLDPEMLMRLSRVLANTDIEPYVRCQNILAKISAKESKRVMSHWFVPIDLILEALLGQTRLISNRWFYRYIEDLLAEKLIAHRLNLIREGDLASSIRVSAATCLSEAFLAFDRAIGPEKRSRVVLEFSIYEVLQAYSRFSKAHQHITEMGYSLSIADIDIRALPWMSIKHLHAQFLKIQMPTGSPRSWLTNSLLNDLPAAIKSANARRLILAKTESQEQIDVARAYGITLFQGEAIEGVFKRGQE